MSAIMFEISSFVRNAAVQERCVKDGSRRTEIERVRSTHAQRGPCEWERVLFTVQTIV